MFGLVGVMMTIGVARGACLSNTTLTALGFTPLAQYTPALTNTYCTDILQTGQACIDYSTLTSSVSAQKIYALQQEANNITAALANSTSVINSFKTLCNNTIVTANVGKTLNGVAITAAMVTTCTSLNNTGVFFLNGTGTTALATQISTCYNTVSNTMNGAYCLLSSSLASNYTTISGNNVLITAATNTASVAFNNCVALIFDSCYLNEVAAFLDVFTRTTTTNAALGQSCGPSSTLATCLSTPSTCSATLQQSIFTAFFMPTGSAIGSYMSKTVGASIVSVRGYNNTRRLSSTPTTMTSSYGVSSTGFDVATTNTGLNSTNGTCGSFLSATFLFGVLALLLG